MIIHKSNLRIVDVIKEDKGIPMLNNIHIDEDGITSAIGNKIVLVMSAVKDSVCKSIEKMQQWGGKILQKGGITIPADSVKEVMKNIPKDTQFKGLLEHVEVDKEGIFKLSDGRRQRVIKCTPWKRDFPEWRKTFDLKRSEGVFRAVYNRKRLLLLLSAIEKCCEDTSGYSPVWIEGCKDGTMIVRSVNMKTGQKALGVVAAYDGKEGEWIEDTEFELKPKTKKILPKRKTLVPKRKIKRKINKRK